MLFGYLSVTDKSATSVFVSLLQEGGGSLASLSDLQRDVIRMELLGAFRAAFLTTAGFAIYSAAIAWMPLRRI